LSKEGFWRIVNSREEFLVKMYEMMWQNITTAADAIWKVMAAYTAVFAGTALASSELGNWGFTLILTIFGLLGMAVCLNANAWFARNIGVVANIEQEFLAPDDYGKIIPTAWKSKQPFVNREVWWCLVLLFLSITFVVVATEAPGFDGARFDALWGLFLLGLLAVMGYGNFLLTRQRAFEAGTRQTEPPTGRLAEQQK
jgi:hypothetical protein